MKFGYTALQHPAVGLSQRHAVRAVPVQQRRAEPVTQTAVNTGEVKFVRNLIPTAFYAQDTGSGPPDAAGAACATEDRGELSRFERGRSRLLADADAGGLRGRHDRRGNWKDITPQHERRLRPVGNGKTARQVNLAEIRPALTASNSEWTWNRSSARRCPPTDGTTATAIRADCNLLDTRPTASAAHGQPELSARRSSRASLDPEFIDGFNKRGNNWELGAACS